VGGEEGAGGKSCFRIRGCRYGTRNSGGVRASGGAHCGSTLDWGGDAGGEVGGDFGGDAGGDLGGDCGGDFGGEVGGENVMSASPGVRP